MSTPVQETPAAKTTRLLEEISATMSALLAEQRLANHRVNLGTEGGGLSSVELEEDSKGKIKVHAKIYLGPEVTTVDAAYAKAAEIVNRGRREFNSGS